MSQYQHQDMHVQGPQINQFNNISPKKIPRSAFKRDFTRKSTFNTNDLVPIFLDEILPGDDVSLKLTAQVRLTTPIKPIMDNLYLETFFFFVPCRLLWSNWEKFQGMQVNPGDSTAFTIPVLDATKAPLTTTGFTVGSIYDYLGLPVLVTAATGSGMAMISALPNRAIDRIWNDWFRDENLDNSLTLQTGDGPDDPGNYALRQRRKRKDYLTSACTAPQKGTAPTIALGGLAPLVGIGIGASPTWSNTGTVVHTTGGIAITPSNANGLRWARGDNTDTTMMVQQDAANLTYPAMYANVGASNAITINTIRQAALYQQIYELDMRGGTRYVESIYSRFGVISPDFRLQRPELIGQGSTRVGVYAVPQTAPTGATGTPQGNLAAFGAAAITGTHGCRYQATEHGYIVGLANVRADLTYQQGLRKLFTRSTRLDFYEPLLNGLGEQTITNDEIYAQGTTADRNAFGYAERFAEYRFMLSEITGLFRSTAAAPLDVWHLSQKFTSLPGLNATFITENVPMSRVVAVTTEPNFYFDASYDYTHVRPMPIRSNPGIERL